MPSTEECCWHGIPLEDPCDECGHVAEQDDAGRGARLICVTEVDKPRW